jgi:carbon-monoxide dehydrogenase small subunit
VSYGLFEEKARAATRVDIEIGYALTGALAQFSRSGIVNDLAERLTAEFARNLEIRLDRGVDSPEAPQQAELDAGSLVLSVVRARIRRFFARLLRR